MFHRNCLLESNPFLKVEQNTFEYDKMILDNIRMNIRNELELLNLNDVKSILEIGPSEFNINRFNFIRNIEENKIYHTLDIIDNGSTYTADITKPLNINYKYDLILLSEVLEHTKNPFSVIKNLKNILNDNGKIFVSFPFNFRLHGPLPDCWRISEFGFRSIVEDAEMKIIKLDALILEERPYFPIHYIAIISK
jgi:SAM-dependent methyltransferase